MQKYRVNEVCHATGLSRKTIYRKMESGELKYFIENGKRHVNQEDVNKIVCNKKMHSDGNPSLSEECVILRTEVTLLRQKVEELTAAINHISKVIDTKNNVSDTGINDSITHLKGDNAKRSEEAKQKLFMALDLMGEIPIYRGKPSITGIYKKTGIDRGTVSKYLNEYIASKG